MRYHLRLASIIVAAALISGILAVSCTPRTEESATSPPSAEEVKRNPAQFEVGPITINSANAMVDTPVEVVVTVKNTGDLDGTYTVALLADGQMADKKDVLVGGGSTEHVQFQISKPKAGTYDLAAGTARALLTVHDWRPYTIQYDDGKPDAWVGYSAWGSRGIALRFTPPSVPFRVEQIAIFGYGVIQKDFSQWDKREFLLRVWNRDMSQAVWYKHFPWRLFKGAVFGDWVNIDVPNIIVNGDFYVEVVTFSEPGVGGWVGDNALLVKAWRGDGDGRSILAEAGTLIPKTGPARDLNWCIRVKGRGP